MVVDDKLRISGNPLGESWGKLIIGIGNLLKNWSVSLTEKGVDIEARNRVKIVTNPTCKLVNPYTLIINFRVDNSNKYQLVLQGDYKETYKDRDENDSPNIDEKTLFMLIYENRKNWFIKD